MKRFEQSSKLIKQCKLAHIKKNVVVGNIKGKLHK